jgi:hypothetical protein
MVHGEVISRSERRCIQVDRIFGWEELLGPMDARKQGPVQHFAGGVFLVSSLYRSRHALSQSRRLDQGRSITTIGEESLRYSRRVPERAGI